MFRKALALMLCLCMACSFALAEELPVETAVEAVAEEAPIEEAPAEDAPAEEAPVEEAPVEEAPVEEAPVEEAPVEEAPAEEAPVEEAPVEEAPVEEAPVEEAPVEEAPVEEAPAEELPVIDELPAIEEMPEEDESSDEIPAEEDAVTEEDAVLPEEDLLPAIDEEVIAEEVIVGEAELPVYSATSGKWNGLSWTYADKVLTITGSGDMETGDTDYPWADLAASVKEIRIGDYVTGIGRYAFQNFTYLKTLVLGSRVTQIYDYAFYGCESLSEVNFASAAKLEIIGSAAFYNCNNLESLVFPSSLKMLHANAFAECDYLTSVTLPENLEYIGYSVFMNCGWLRGHVTIPATVTKFYDTAFYGTNLSSVTINANCAIPKQAFYLCDSLTTVTFGSGVTGIGESAFENCTALTDVNIPGTVKTIGQSAFEGCTSMANLTLNEGLNEIGYEAFYLSGITSLTLPSTVTYINDKAFVSCRSLKTVDMSKLVQCTLRPSLFVGCTALTTANLGAACITGIPSYCFESCKSLTDITWPPNLTIISNNAFQACPGPASIVLPSSVTTISAYAFSGCSNVKSVTLGKNIESLGYGAFNCSALEELTIYSADAEMNYMCLTGSKALTIYGYAGSTADVYASENGINFVELSGSMAAPDAPVLSRIQNTTSGIRITWKPVAGATHYAVLRTTSETGTGYLTIKDSVTSTSFDDKNVLTGKTYRYVVMAYNGAIDSAYSNELSLVHVASIALPTCTNSLAGIKLSWKLSENATGYALFRKNITDGENWKRIKTVSASTSSYTDSVVCNSQGKAYQYQVRALYGTELAASRSAGTGILRIKGPTLRSAEVAGKNAIKCTWSTSKTVEGYQIRFYADASYQRMFQINTASTFKKTFTGLRSGVTYKVQVRSFQSYEGVNHYSAWSSAINLEL